MDIKRIINTVLLFVTIHIVLGKPSDSEICARVQVCGHDGKSYPTPCHAPAFPPPCANYKFIGPKGSNSCICSENNPCSQGVPLANSSGDLLICGGGLAPSKHFDTCPRGYSCNADFAAFDGPALCCSNAGWDLGLNINPCDDGNFGYGGPWSKGVNVGTSDQAFTRDFIDINILKRPARFITIARHVNGQCSMSKTWELMDKTRSMYSYFSTYPGRIYATGDGSRSDQHIAEDIPQSAEGLTGTWRDPIFGADGGLVFNWYYGNNGVRIALPSGYKVPYTLPGANVNNEDLHGLGMEFNSDTINGRGSNDWQDVGKVGPDCRGGNDCEAVGTDHKDGHKNGSCWGSYAIFVSQEANSFNCQGRSLSLTMK